MTWVLGPYGSDSLLTRVTQCALIKILIAKSKSWGGWSNEHLSKKVFMGVGDVLETQPRNWSKHLLHC